MAIINFEKLETAIVETEKHLKQYNSDERELILKNILVRMQREKQKLMQKDMMGNIDINSFMKRIIKGQEEESSD